MRYVQLLAIFFLYTSDPVGATLAEAEHFLHNDYETAITDACYDLADSRINFQTDLMNDTKMEIYVEALVNIMKTRSMYSLKLVSFRLPFIIDDADLRREIKRAMVGFSFESDKKRSKYAKTFSGLDRGFNTAKICPYRNQECNLATEGLSLTEIEDDMAKSLDYDEMLYLWQAWRKATAKLTNLFKSYHGMETEIAEANNFSNVAEFQQFFYDNKDTIDYTLELWHEVEPLYLELHKYVSRKLKHHYGDKLDISDGMLPAHVLGNMWAESWYPIEPLVRPFPNVSDGNLEQNMKKLFKVEDIFRVADEFFQSLGLEPMEAAYEGPDQMLTKPTDGREVACHPSSTDYCNGTYRVIVCAKVNLENFINIHHELGHIQYFIQYRKLPYFLRDSASPFFHETIGESLALSATAPSHLQRLELLTDYQETYESSINFLMKMALIKVAFLPFGLIVDKWKWDIGSRKIPVDQWNSHWWEYRTKYQRIKPPVPRTDADFDPVAKYHVVLQADFMSYFHAHFMEFQIYKSLCMTAREFKPAMYKMCPLHDCDFYNSKEAGKKLVDVLRLGYRKPWTEVAETLTGYSNISSEPFLEYFKPLYEYLIKENERAEKEERERPVHILKRIDHTFAAIMSVVVILIIGFVVFYFTYLRRRRVRWLHLFFQ